MYKRQTYIGGQKEGTHGRGVERKTLVLVAAEGDRKKLGRVRFRCVETIDRATIELFARDYIEPGTRVITDDKSVYDGLIAEGFRHSPHAITTGGEAEFQYLDHVHLVIALLKRWLADARQGTVTSSHLQAYLNEFAFRFNRHLSQHRGKLFYRLMQHSVTARPATVRALYVSKPRVVGNLSQSATI